MEDPAAPGAGTRPPAAKGPLVLSCADGGTCFGSLSFFFKKAIQATADGCLACGRVLGSVLFCGNSLRVPGRNSAPRAQRLSSGHGGNGTVRPACSAAVPDSWQVAATRRSPDRARRGGPGPGASGTPCSVLPVTRAPGGGPTTGFPSVTQLGSAQPGRRAPSSVLGARGPRRPPHRHRPGTRAAPRSVPVLQPAGQEAAQPRPLRPGGGCAPRAAEGPDEGPRQSRLALDSAGSSQSLCVLRVLPSLLTPCTASL